MPSPLPPKPSPQDPNLLPKNPPPLFLVQRPGEPPEEFRARALQELDELVPPSPAQQSQPSPPKMSSPPKRQPRKKASPPSPPPAE